MSTASSPTSHWDIQFLSQPKLRLQSVQAGSKSIFSSATACDIYDLRSDSWQTHQFNLPRRGISSIASGQNAFFAGGVRGPQYAPEFVSRVDIYNVENAHWHHSTLSQAREVGGAGSHGNIVVFAGGTIRNGYSNRADIFNTQHSKRIQYNLSDARAKLTVGAAGNKIVFAGGVSGNITSPVSSGAVDIYEVHSDTWNTSTLSEKRHAMAVASIGNKIIFAGGLTSSAAGSQPSNAIDIYDAIRNSWKKAVLSEAKHGVSVAVAGNKVYFAGGLLKNDILSDKLEVYDLETDSWTVSALSAPRYGMAVAVTASGVVFAGGFINNLRTTTNRIEVLDIATETWSVEHLSQPHANVAIAVQKDKIIFAGGTDYTGTIATATTDIWNVSGIVQHAMYADAMHPSNNATRRQHEWVYADPENRNFIIADLWRYETHTVNISILNSYREAVLTKSVIPFGDTKEQIDVSNLQQGRYWVLVECTGRKPVLTKIDIENAIFEPRSDDHTLAMAPYSIRNQLTSRY